eukprot:SAG31_NODE_23529_length_500_cov_0.940447_1_plen_47_part_10
MLLEVPSSDEQRRSSANRPANAGSGLSTAPPLDTLGRGARRRCPSAR